MKSGEKRLYRLLVKLLRYPQQLVSDGAGGFSSTSNQPVKVHFPARLARIALSRGLLEPCGAHQVKANDETQAWVRRQQNDKDLSCAKINSFSAQHWQLEEREIFDESGEMILVQVNVADSPLLRLFRQKDAGGDHFLSAAEFAAGEKLRRDYAASCMGRMSATDWTKIRQDTNAACLAAASDGSYISGLDARRRVMSALKSVGPVMDRLLFSTLIREQGLTKVEQDQNWPRRSAKIVLKIALCRLANYYGLNAS